MIIGGRDLTRERLLIAEIGNNHEGNPKLALEMVDEAVQAGADAIKIQVIVPERLVNRSQTQRIEQLTRFRLPMETIAEMAQMARSKDALFMASVMDPDSLEAIAPLLDAVKIASGDLDFLPLLARAAEKGKPIILSTGMSTLEEIETSVEFIASSLTPGLITDRLALLHCVSLYPAELADANLRVIQTLHDRFNLTVGYSDHTLGIECSVAALGLGARIVEKHFTLDKSLTSFRDHALSADPHDLRRLADVIHKYDIMLGTGEKHLSDAEHQMAMASRRSIVAARDLPAGTRLTMADLDCIRPRNGLKPAALPALVGRILRAALIQHETVLEEHLES